MMHLHTTGTAGRESFLVDISPHLLREDERVWFVQYRSQTLCWDLLCISNTLFPGLRRPQRCLDLSRREVPTPFGHPNQIVR